MTDLLGQYRMSLGKDPNNSLIERYIRENLVLIKETRDYECSKTAYEFGHKLNEYLCATIWQPLSDSLETAETAAVELMRFQLKRAHDCADILSAYVEDGGK